eukprot:EST46100.1 Hypothetical protein SS50377_14094 [Spironucleus salmonicida]
MRLDLLKNNLDSRVFTATRIEKIRQNPFLTELPFIDQFLKLNLDITAESQKENYLQSEKLTYIINELQGISLQLSQSAQIQKDCMAIFKEAPIVSKLIQNITQQSSEIEEQSKYVKAELLRFPQQNAQVIQLNNDLETQEKALFLIHQIQSLQNLASTVNYLLQNNDYPAAVLLITLGEFSLSQIDQNRLGVNISLNSLKERILLDLQDQIVNTILQITNTRMESNLIYISKVKSSYNFEQLSQAEVVSKLNYFRVAISKRCKTHQQVFQFLYQFQDVFKEMCNNSEYIDDIFIDERQLPNDVTISLEEYILVLAQCSNILSPNQGSFYSQILGKLNDKIHDFLQSLQTNALQYQLPKLQISINNGLNDFFDQQIFLVNLGIAIDIPEIADNLKRSTMLYRLFGQRLYFILFLSYQFSQGLNLKTGNPTQLASFQQFLSNIKVPQSFFDIQTLFKLAYEFFLELSKYLFNISDNILYLQNYIKQKLTSQSLFSIEQIPQLINFISKTTFHDIDQQFACSEFNILYSEKVFTSLVDLFQALQIDKKTNIAQYSQSTNIKSLNDLQFNIFEDFYNKFTNKTLLQEILLLEKQNLLFIIKKTNKQQVFNIQICCEKITEQLKYLQTYSKQGEIRYFKLKAILCYNLNTIIFDYVKKNYFYLYSVQLAFKQQYEGNTDNLIDIHNFYKKLEDSSLYNKKLSPSQQQFSFTEQFIIASNVLNITNIKELYHFIIYLVEHFGEVKQINSLLNQIKLSLILEYRFQLYYNLFRIKRTFNSQIGHVSAIQDLQAIMSFFKAEFPINKLFDCIFIEIFTNVDFTDDKNSVKEILNIIKVLYSVNGSMDTVVAWLRQKANI